MNENEKQIKSRERVRDHGEVYTSAREVNAMLDLVYAETQRIDSRFLEPACGDGNFLISILERKLEVVERCYKKSQVDFEAQALLALSSIYGIDILEDNIKHARQRLFNAFEAIYTELYPNSINRAFLNAAQFILDKNLICGDALEVHSITFTSWSLIGQHFKREEYKFDELHQDDSDSLFGFHQEHNTDPADALFSPIREYELTHYTQLTQYDDKKNTTSPGTASRTGEGEHRGLHY